jgi:steroid 5-alpha reductase family enzyme
MKNIQILVLFLIGSALVIAGVLFKITNEPKDWTSLFLIVGMTFEAVAGILLLLKLFKKNKNNSDSFLDS